MTGSEAATLLTIIELAGRTSFQYVYLSLPLLLILAIIGILLACTTVV